MRGQDRRDKPRAAGVDLVAARGVVHLDPLPLAADEAGLAQRLEVLREGGLGDGVAASPNRIYGPLKYGSSNDSRWPTGEKLVASGGMR